MMRSQSPIGKLISRHTRDLFRHYFKAGKMQTPIADREVEDRFVPLSPGEASIYEAVENYISTTYNQASAKEKNAVGFVMTIYRRRLASSFAALRHTLEDRLTATRHSSDEDARSALAGNLEQQAEAAKQDGFDLDAMLDGDLEEPPRPAPKLTLADLDLILQRPDALPPGVVVKKFGNGEYAYQTPGMPEPIRITTRPDYFDEHSESLELWSPGSPLFPDEAGDGATKVDQAEDFSALLK
jgi:hypothetical protein